MSRDTSLYDLIQLADMLSSKMDVASASALDIGRGIAQQARANSRNFLKTDAGKRFGLACAGVALGAALVWLVRRIDFHVRLGGKYGPLFIYNVPTARGRWLRLMIVDGVCQSATYHGKAKYELPFEYYRAFDRAFETGAPIRKIAMLGGGGFCYPKHVLTRRSEVCMDVAEADFQTIRAALDFFYVDELLEACPERLHIFEAEALDFLQNSEENYDLIINDAFAGSCPDQAMAQIEGVRTAKARLNQGGMYMANVVAYPCAHDYEDLAQASVVLGEVFAHVWIVPSSDGEFSDEENYLVIASDTDYVFPESMQCR